MIGKFNIMMVHYRGETEHGKGWLVHLKNTTQKHFFNFVGVSHTCTIATMKRDLLKRLFTDCSDKKFNSTAWSLTDCKRPLCLDEYMDLAFALKAEGYKYNKKTDKLITI